MTRLKLVGLLPSEPDPLTGQNAHFLPGVIIGVFIPKVKQNFAD